MKRIATGLAATLAASAAVVTLGAAPASAAVTSTVKILGFNAEDTDNVKFFGVVNSRKGVCERNRRVTLRQVDQGILAGRDWTNRRGRWTVVFDGNRVEPGRFKAIIERKVVRKDGRRIVCAGDTHTYNVDGS